MNRAASPRFSSTSLGILATVLWSTTVAFSRSLTEQLGTLTAASCIYMLSGTLGCAWLLGVTKGFRNFRPPGRYLLGCGSLFVAYAVLLYLAIGLADSRQQAIEVGIINYLWPSFTLVLSIPILGHRVRWAFAPGVALAVGGAVLATVGGIEFCWSRFVENLQDNYIPYVLALAAALTWAAYSNLSRLWAGNAESGAVPVFLLASGVVLVVARLFVTEQSHWAPRVWPELLYMAVLPGLLGYVFWEAAMRKGHMVLVAAIAYCIPLLSTMISCLYLRVAMGFELWLACGLVIAGAVTCKWSIIERSAAAKST